MRILTCCHYFYYNDPRAIEPQFYYLFKVPETMGHTVDFFDWATADKIGREQMRRLFLSILKSGQYDAAFIATYKDELDEETLAEAKKYCKTFAWNSDDEFRWESYSEQRVNWYTYMVTNSPQVYRKYRSQYPNLLHAQWACTGFWDGKDVEKKIDLSFAGQVYGARKGQIDWLSRKVGLRAFGKGTNYRPRILDNIHSSQKSFRDRLIDLADPFLRKVMHRPDILTFDQVNRIWNLSRISFTPLDSSSGTVLQIKSRIFDQGLSGTLMLAQPAPDLNTYYEPDKEYVAFENLEECADKARFYLKNEASRKKIAQAYRERTLAEHLWKHRIENVIKNSGLSREK